MPKMCIKSSESMNSVPAKTLYLSMLFFTTSCSLGNKLSFKDSYLIYGNTIKDEEYFWCSYFYHVSTDTVTFANSFTFGSRYDVVYPIEDTLETNGDTATKEQFILRKAPYQARPSYTVKRIGNDVYFTFIYKGTTVTERRYSLKKNDTCIARKAAYFENHRRSTKSVFTGHDTTINFYNNKIRCWKFIEIPAVLSLGIDRPVGEQLIVIEKYVEKKSFVPILQKRQTKYTDGTIKEQNEILRLILDEKEVAGREYEPYD